MKARRFGTLAWLCAVSAFGCAPSMEPPTKIQTLRILGVQKDKPYALPGDEVRLTMLWHDGSIPVAQDMGNGDGDDGGNGGDGSGNGGDGGGGRQREVRIGWLGGCFNPPGDTYSGCYQQFAAALAANGAQTIVEGTPLSLPSGSKFTLQIPPDAALHPSQDPKLPRYGLSYVFFALCAGKIVAGDEHFPIHCHDAYERELGPDDFVFGYSSIYFFAPQADGSPRYSNANPVNDGLLFGPDQVTEKGATCSGDECLGKCDDTGCVNAPAPEVNCTATPTLCMSPCADDGDPTKCPPHDLRLDIDPTTFEKDQVTNDAYGRDYGEQMWIDYYATAGKFHSATKLLNDATTGYNRVNGTQYYAPRTPGPVRLWVVTHDNRGGVSWVGTTLKIQ